LIAQDDRLLYLTERQTSCHYQGGDSTSLTKLRYGSLLLSAALLIDLGSAVFYADATTASFCAQKSFFAPRTL